MIQNNYLGKISNYLCTICTKHAENLMRFPQQKCKTSVEVSENEHEEDNTNNYVSRKNEILITNVRHKTYLSQTMSN